MAAVRLLAPAIGQISNGGRPPETDVRVQRFLTPSDGAAAEVARPVDPVNRSAGAAVRGGAVRFERGDAEDAIARSDLAVAVNGGMEILTLMSCDALSSMPISPRVDLPRSRVDGPDQMLCVPGRMSATRRQQGSRLENQTRRTCAGTPIGHSSAARSQPPVSAAAA